MKVILLNQNPAVSRLVRLSIEKIGYKLEEYSNIAQLDEQNPADVFICDHELVDDNIDYTPFGKHIIFLVPRNFAKKLGKHTLEKPFLPTDFMDFVERVATSGDDEAGLVEPTSNDFSDTSADSQDFSSGLDDVDLDGFDDFDDLADDVSLDIGGEPSELDSKSSNETEDEGEAAKIADESSEADTNIDENSDEDGADEPKELDTENLDDILGQLDLEDDDASKTSEVSETSEVGEVSDEELDTTLADAFVDGGEDDLIEDKIPAELASSDAEGENDLIEESIPESLADEKKEQLAQLSSMVDEIDEMDEQSQESSENISEEIKASDEDDSLDMTDFKDLVGVSDEPEAEEESADEVAGLEEIAEDVVPTDETEALDEVVADEVVADETPTSSELSQEERIARLKEEMAKAEEKTAAVRGEALGDEDIEISDEVQTSDDDSLDMTDFKELVGVSDEPEAHEAIESTDEVAGLEEITEDIAPADEIASIDEIAPSDEISEENSDDDSLDMTDFKELVGVSDEPEEEVADESADEISGIEEEIAEQVPDELAEVTQSADEIAKTADEIAPSDELSDEIADEAVISDEISDVKADESTVDDEFGSIDESDLAAALGLDTADIPKSSTASSPKQENSSVDIEQAKSQISSQITETIGATLASSPALKEAIKGMKIKINISFEE